MASKLLSLRFAFDGLSDGGCSAQKLQASRRARARREGDSLSFGCCIQKFPLSNFCQDGHHFTHRQMSANIDFVGSRRTHSILFVPACFLANVENVCEHRPLPVMIVLCFPRDSAGASAQSFLSERKWFPRDSLNNMNN